MTILFISSWWKLWKQTYAIQVKLFLPSAHCNRPVYALFMPTTAQLEIV